MKKTTIIIIILLIISPLDSVMGGKLKQVQAELETCNQEKASVQTVLDETVVKLNGAVKENDQLLFQQKVLESEVARLEADLATAPFEEYEAIKQKYAELEEVKNRVIAMLDERMTFKDQALKELKVQKEGLESQINSIQREMDRLKVENETLQSEAGVAAN